RARHVRMLELSGRDGLPREALGHVAIARELRVDDLDGHLLHQLEMLADEHRPHAAFAEQPLEPITPVEHPADPLVVDVVARVALLELRAHFFSSANRLAASSW